MKKAKLLMLIIAVAFLASCQKPQKGDTGATGKNGIDGNANVVGTNSVTVTWTLDGAIYNAGLNAQGITQDIVDKGLVQVFILYGTEWYILPDITGINSTTYGFSVGHISLLNYNSDGSTPDYPSNSTFRVVLISSSNKLANPNTNWNNYNEVKRIFNIID